MPKDKKSQADKLVELVNENQSKIELFHNELKQSFAYLDINGHGEIWPCDGKRFKDWLSYLFYKSEKKIPHSNSITNALAVIRGAALNEGKEYKLGNRIAKQNDSIWYDLSNDHWEAIRIDKNGWQIAKPPILIQRFSHQQSQSTPTSGGNVHDLLSLINIKEEHKLLLLVYIVSCFIPDFPHPILVIHGPQGSAKSTLSKMIKRLVDPSALETCDFPATKAELAQILFHHYYIVFDNLSNISESNSDILCRAVTGGGFSKRELYTNDDDFIYTFKRLVNLNGINPVATKPDLLERSILLELERIPDEARQKESDVLTTFEEKIPLLLGAIFDAVSKATSIKETLNLPILPRMADFAEWGCAIAVALGYSQSDFLSAYSASIQSQNDQVISDSSICSTLLKLMESQTKWEGTPTQLLSELTEKASDLQINIKEPSWPKSAALLSRKLNNFKTNLEAGGIKIKHAWKDKQRIISISNHSIPPESNSGNGIATNNDGNDRNDDFLTSLNL